MARVLLVLAIVLSLVSIHSAQSVPPLRSAATIASMDACGDSISKAFNARSAFPCPNADQEPYNYATSDTSGADVCAPGPEGVFSHAERIKCLKGAAILSAAPNSAEDGARMLGDFVGQANQVYSRLIAQPAPRYVPVLLGQNDVCGGRLFKYHLSCPAGADQDRNNYCRTTPAAFERELRKGLDILMTIPDVHLGVSSLVRVSQLCNHAAKRNCQTFTSCRDLWTAAAYAGVFLGLPGGLCGSLTASCSDSRISDAYRTARVYRDILARVTTEYANISPGAPSRIVVIGGQTVGGSVKSEGVTIAHSDAPWRYKFSSAELSCCDCFHPSAAGQNTLADILFNGITCTPGRPCCFDSGDPVSDGRCSSTDTSGTYYRGLF